jgi:hypothetical protein
MKLYCRHPPGNQGPRREREACNKAKDESTVQALPKKPKTKAKKGARKRLATSEEDEPTVQAAPKIKPQKGASRSKRPKRAQA